MRIRQYTVFRPVDHNVRRGPPAKRLSSVILQYHSTAARTAWFRSPAIGHMDDGTLGDSQQTVAKDVQRVIEVEHDMGLNINVSRCERIAHPECYVSDPTLRSFQQIPTKDVELSENGSRDRTTPFSGDGLTSKGCDLL